MSKKNLVNVTTVSQALEQQRARLKLSESPKINFFPVYNAVGVGKVFIKTFQKF